MSPAKQRVHPVRTGNPAPAESPARTRRRSVSWMLAVVAAGLASSSPPFLLAEAGAQEQVSLTAMDYVEIQQLVNKLNFALDYCGNGGEDFAELFAEGGRYVIDRGDGMPIVRDTREELVALAGGPDCEARRTPPSSYILHLAESLVIEPVPGGARGTSYAIYPSSAGRFFDEETAGQLGIYHDEYVRTAEGWRVRSRRHEIDPDVGSVEFLPELRGAARR
ncbi:MAG: nuclear transport factor 2 family protein [Gammaproteobacteria bacterium]|nr:nuclear transport factor 2 family protein [Gammaproteobacteria bacterium]